MNDRYGEAQTLWGRARTHASQATPDWTAALADLDRAIELVEAMEPDRRSGDLGRRLGLKDLPLA
jgi:hypothetical protein